MNDSRSGDIDRKFYDFQEPHSLNNFNDLCSTKYPSTDFDQSEKLFQLIRENEIGRNQIFSGPFGLRKGTRISVKSAEINLNKILDLF